MRYLSLIALFLLIAFSSKAEPLALGKNGAWEAYHYKKSGHHVCYMLSSPEKQEIPYAGRESPFLFITHRPRSRQYDEVTVDNGYDFKAKTPLTLLIGTQKFTLSTDKRRAWAEDVRTDKQLVRTMKSGDTLTVEAESGSGTTTKDMYSLKGFTATYRLISDQCQ